MLALSLPSLASPEALVSIVVLYIPGSKGGVVGPDAPKIQALPEWGGGLTLAWIFVKDLSTCTEGPQR